MIKLAEENNESSSSVFNIEKYTDEAFNTLMTLVQYNKTGIIWRSK